MSLYSLFPQEKQKFPRNIREIEDTLIKSRVLSLPGRKALLQIADELWSNIGGCYRNPYWATQKKQRRFYSGKKKRPTLKTQLVIDKASQKVICTSFIHGKRHDFHLFKQSGVRFQASTQLLTDSGYQGLEKIHANACYPTKSPGNDPWQRKKGKQTRPLLASGYSMRTSWVGLKVSKSFRINIQTGISALDWGLIWLPVFTILS